MKKIIQPVTFLILITLSFWASAQDARESYTDGMSALNRGNFQQAINKFKEAVNLKNDYQDAWYYLGISFGYAKDYQNVVYSMSRLKTINPNYNPWMYYEACKALTELDNLEDAENAANMFLSKLEDKPINMASRHQGVYRLNYAVESRKVRAAKPTMTAPQPIATLNSKSGDYMPQVNPTGTRLYFTSVRKGGFDNPDANDPTDFGEDLYYSSLVNNAWSAPKLLPEPLNSMGDDFGSAFTGDGQVMVYVKCDTEEGIGNCDLYITQLVGTEWSKPVNMGNVVNSDDWDSQPTISADGNRVIYTSARAGGYGGSDIYMIEKNQLGEWGIPQNLGGIVNTPFNENSPYLAPDGKTLYFASNGHPGFGGMDIFYCIFENGKWSTPKNLGAPLNSRGDDTNFSISAEGMGYFSSSRLDGSNFEIFQIELPDELKPKPTVVVQGIVSNSKTLAPIGAVVLIEDINSGELISVNKSNSSSGEYLVVLPAGRNYSVSASSKGFFFYSQSFEIPADTSYQEIINNIALEPIEKGTKVVLNNIFFESGRAELKPISYVELNKAVDLLKDNNTMVIEIGGHTDDVGSDELNLSLSQTRADAVRQYMVLAGIEENRVRSKGYGETQPIADNSTAEGKAKNRRTEFEIVEF
ncbi:OmpA family protein [Marinoscillum pacificum]|uniref:OmpA family protein n=1 Tax=Marinoscillum pacificum TaxID=392723 RepID=UPI00215712BD|nr:OmpA family protein [Marinoscillum pacificum]